MQSNSISYFTPTGSNADFVHVDGEIRVRYEGKHPEHGEVCLEVNHMPDGIIFSLQTPQGEELESGWMSLADIAEYVH